jgi:hypothetical protein
VPTIRVLSNSPRKVNKARLEAGERRDGLAGSAKGCGQGVDGAASEADKILESHALGGGEMAMAASDVEMLEDKGQGQDKLSNVSPCLMPTGKQQQQKRIFR